MIINIDAKTVNKILKVDVEELLTNHLKSFIQLQESVRLDFVKQEDGSYTVHLLKEGDESLVTTRAVKSTKKDEAKPEVKEKEKPEVKEEPVTEKKVEEEEEVEEVTDTKPSTPARRSPKSLFDNFNSKRNSK